MKIKFGDTAANDESVVLPFTAVTASWTAKGDVASYAYEITKANGDVFDSGNGADATSYEIAENALNLGEVYTLTVTVIPTNGTENDATIVTATFMRNILINGFVISNGVVIDYIGSGGEIVVPDNDGEGNDITAIGDEVFKGNTTITSVTIPATITVIGESAFEGCSGLESVVIPNGVSTIGKAAFKNCEKLASMTAFD